MGTSHGYADIAAAESAGLQQYYIPRQGDAVTAINIASVGYTNDNAGSTYSGSNSTDAAGSNYTAGSSAAYNNAAAAAIGSAADHWQYHHTTSIYHNDGKTLWRVEYYDENNNLKEYSSVTNVDLETNSYTENIYSYDEENGKEVLERTDTYVNGKLQSSISGS